MHRSASDHTVPSVSVRARGLRTAALATGLTALVAGLVLFSFASSAAAATCWLPPVNGVVTDPFREPACPYCAGNRGIDYAVGDDTAVRAVAAGVVSWSGVIDATRYVVVRHTNGWRATYGELDSTALSTGSRVLARTVIGRASGALYFGLRRGDTYVDPAPFLGRLVGRPRLVPVDGTRSRPAPPPQVRCGPVIPAQRGVAVVDRAR